MCKYVVCINNDVNNVLCINNFVRINNLVCIENVAYYMNNISISNTSCSYLRST